jgi:hypothetical protein
MISRPNNYYRRKIKNVVYLQGGYVGIVICTTSYESHTFFHEFAD